jgi:DNA polymerase III gamma/tau subunit
VVIAEVYTIIEGNDMALYQKVRPVTLDEVVGNPRTIKALGKMLKSDDRPRAILMQGPSGCGKTTVGRILAREFGSDETSIFESNAANCRGIDDIREIARTAGHSVLGGKPKTYIIDESHQLTKPAQQALLKVLEDKKSAPNARFILCTTDPQNLIKTIRNRCVDYTMGKLRGEEILELVHHVNEKEQLGVAEEIMQVVAGTSDGSPRATINALEKVMGIEEIDDAIQLLLKGTEFDGEVIDICKMLNAEPHIRKKNCSKIIFMANKLEVPPEQIRNSIMTYLSKMAVTAKEDSFEELSDLNYAMSTIDSRYYITKATLINLLMTVCLVPNPNPMK